MPTKPRALKANNRSPSTVRSTWAWQRQARSARWIKNGRQGERRGKIKWTNKMNTKLSLIECNGAHEITIYFLSAGQKAKRSNRLGEGSRKEAAGRRGISIYVMAVYATEVWNSHKTIKEKGTTHTHALTHTLLHSNENSFESLSAAVKNVNRTWICHNAYGCEQKYALI